MLYVLLKLFSLRPTNPQWSSSQRGTLGLLGRGFDPNALRINFVAFILNSMRPSLAYHRQIVVMTFISLLRSQMTHYSNVPLACAAGARK